MIAFFACGSVCLQKLAFIDELMEGGDGFVLNIHFGKGMV